jgi:hypothetical protein
MICRPADRAQPYKTIHNREIVMAIQPTQPQSIGGVLDISFQLFKASFVKVLPFSVLLAIGGALPSIYMMVNGTSAAADPLAMLSAVQSPQYWLWNLASVLISLVGMGAVYLQMNAVGTDTELSFGAALQGALSRAPILFLTMILFIVALTIGLVLLIIPGLILMVSLLLSFNLVMIERAGPIAALTGSHQLVWGNWWRTMIILTVGFILLVVIYMAIGMILGLVTPLIASQSADPFFFAMLSSVIIASLATFIVTPYYGALAIAIYWDLKLRKEGGDLAARVGALGTA